MLTLRTYTVHARPGSAASDGDAVFVRDGFSWPAFILGPFWAIWFGMWRTAIGLLLLSGGISGLVLAVGMAEAGKLVVTLALQAVMGLWGNDWRRYVLRRSDMAERAVVSGRNARNAEDRYFVGRAGHG
jgi:hypothetical protein